jgi:NADH-quinone oxidoreductase subunit J
MNITEILFYAISAIAIISGLLVVANPFTRDPVASAIALVISLLSVAGLFILQGAFFLAAIQLIIYAGAVIVMFLFILMLSHSSAYWPKPRYIKGLLTVVIVGGLCWVLIKRLLPDAPLPFDEVRLTIGSTKAIGKSLFTDYILATETASVLLMMAMVGVVWITKRN